MLHSVLNMFKQKHDLHYPDFHFLVVVLRTPRYFGVKKKYDGEKKDELKVWNANGRVFMEQEVPNGREKKERKIQVNIWSR